MHFKEIWYDGLIWILVAVVTAERLSASEEALYSTVGITLKINFELGIN